jgi:hypothetical protein
MNKTLFVCGDSYASGSGLKPEYCLEKSFGGLVASEIGAKHVNFSRAGICNFGIFLQVKKVLTEFNFNTRQSNSTIIISLTDPSRLMVGTEELKPWDLDLSNVDYKNNTPYNYGYYKGRDTQFKLNDKPKLFSQTILDILLHIDKKVSGALQSAYEILPHYKLSTLKTYITDVFDYEIKSEYDNALVAKMHLILKSKNINHIFLVPFIEQYDYIPQENLCEVNWRKISDEHPDEMGSGHCNETGHEIASKMILDQYYKILKNKKTI